MLKRIIRTGIAMMLSLFVAASLAGCDESGSGSYEYDTGDNDGYKSFVNDVDDAGDGDGTADWDDWNAYADDNGSGHSSSYKSSFSTSSKSYGDNGEIIDNDYDGDVDEDDWEKAWGDYLDDKYDEYDIDDDDDDGYKSFVNDVDDTGDGDGTADWDDWNAYADDNGYNRAY